MVTPKDDTIPYKVYGSQIKNSAEEVDQYRIRSFSVESKNESSPKRFIPSDFEAKPKVVYSNFENWQEVSSWYDELSSHKQQKTTQLSATADSLFQGLSNPLEKVKKVYDYIYDNISYSSVPFRQSGWVPQNAQDVLMTKIGDCKDMASLGKALLNIGGVESYLVLENGNQRYFTDHTYMGPNFNHCILGYKVNDSLEFVDFTTKYTPFGSIPKYIQGTMALVVNDSSNALIKLPMDAPKSRRKIRKSVVILKDDKSVQATVHTQRVGSFADDFRYYYRSSSEKEQKESMKNILSKRFADLELKVFTVPNLTKADDSLEYTYAYEARNALVLSGNMAIYTVDVPDEISAGSFPTDTTRTEPIDMGYRSLAIGTFNSTTEITIPTEWKLTTTPDNIEIKTENMSYSLRYTKNGNEKITITREVETNYNRLFTANEFKADIIALKNASQSDNIQLLFTINK